ncbi:uncharacterized protein TNCV_3600311 [Trichonephila clavipes]|nr:uncharacterized protein TNCV_3600311 [Trichonephila clavipes]
MGVLHSGGDGVVLDGKIPAQLARAYLKGHLKGRALDWFEVLGYRVIEDKTTDYAHLKQALSEQFPCLEIRGSSEGFRSSGPNEGNRFNTRHRQENWRKTEIMRDTPIIADHKGNLIDSKTKVSQIIADSRVDAKVDNRINHSTHSQGGRQSGSRNSSFRGQNERTLWNTGAEKSFISEEVYRNYFSYRPRQKTKDRVVTAQGAPCSHLGRVELQIRIREFQKPWEFHVLDNMQYQCILGIDFMKASRLTLDFDQKSLIIPDNLIKQVPKEKKPVDIDLTESKLDDEQQRQIKALFNNFKGLFSDQPGLTHVVYHEIDTGDKGPVVSRPYKYDRVKQGIIDCHIDKMLRDGTICPINSPYASPVVLTRKKNDLPPDSPEALSFRDRLSETKWNYTKYP